MIDAREARALTRRGRENAMWLRHISNDIQGAAYAGRGRCSTWIPIGEEGIDDAEFIAKILREADFEVSYVTKKTGVTFCIDWSRDPASEVI